MSESDEPAIVHRMSKVIIDRQLSGQWQGKIYADWGIPSMRRERVGGKLKDDLFHPS